MVRGFALQPARIFLFTQYLTGQSLPADVLFKPLGRRLEVVRQRSIASAADQLLDTDWARNGRLPADQN
jgi:hypothetical protein